MLERKKRRRQRNLSSRRILLRNPLPKTLLTKKVTGRMLLVRALATMQDLKGLVSSKGRKINRRKSKRRKQKYPQMSRRGRRNRRTTRRRNPNLITINAISQSRTHNQDLC